MTALDPHTPFDELPVNEALGMPHAWDALERDKGTLTRMTPETVLAAMGQVRDGTLVSLNLPVTEPDPPLFGRQPLVHEIYELSRNDIDDKMDSFYPQASSQWDGLRHVRAREHGFFGGVDEDFKPGPGTLGIEHWKDGIVGRGVLLDLVAHFAAEGTDYDPIGGHPIQADDLRACCERQGVTLERGDVLCLRTGWIESFRALEDDARAKLAAEPVISGLAGSEDNARFLWDAGLIAVAADNPPIEVAPGDRNVGSLHRRILPMLGFAISELLDLQRLAELSAADGRHTFLFVAVPLNLPGGVGSPANAVAIR